MKEVATIMTKEEFQRFLAETGNLVEEWKNDGLGYVSVKCQLADMLTGSSDDAMVLTIGQLRQIFQLAK